MLFIGLGFGFLGCGEDDSGPTGPVLNAPQELVATALSETQISLTWTNVDEFISGYKIQRAEGAGGSFSQLIQLEGDVKTYTDSDLSEGSTYKYKVQSFQRDTDSPFSGEASATTPPIAPSDLMAERVSGSEIDIFWTDNSAIEENYEVQMRISGNPEYETVATLDPDVVEYSVTDLVESTVYQFRVRAVFGENFSAWSNMAQQETVVFTPTPPSELEAETMGSSEIALTWADNSHNEEGFVIELSLTGEGEWSPKDSVDRNFGTRRRFTVGQLTGLTEYYFRVYAYNDSGPSPYTNIVSATTIQGPPLMPTDLVIDAPSYTHVEMSWTDNSLDELGFILERKHESSNWGQIDSLVENTTSFNDDEIFPRNRYMYRICSVNAVGRSSWLASEDWTAVPDGPPNAPTDLEATPLDMARINLRWTDASNNEGGFILERSLSGADDFAVIAELTAGVEFYGDTGLEQETAYDYRVKSVREDEDGYYESDYSDIATAATFGPLSTPANLVAIPVNTQVIRLQWQDQSFAESGFIVERAPGGENNFNIIADVAPDTPVHVDSGLDESTEYSYRVKAYMVDNGDVEESDYSNIATAETFSQTIIEQGFEEFEAGSAPPEESGWGYYNRNENSDSRLLVSEERAMEGGTKSLFFNDMRGNLENSIVVLKEHRSAVRSNVRFNLFFPSFGDIFAVRGGNQNNQIAWEIYFATHPTDGNIVAVRQGNQLLYTRGVNFPLGQWNTVEVISNCLASTSDVIINGTPYRSGWGAASMATEGIVFVCFSGSVENGDSVWEQAYLDDVLIEEVVDEGANAFEMPNPGPVRDQGLNVFDTETLPVFQAR